jgi:hypothetical protein
MTSEVVNWTDLSSKVEELIRQEPVMTDENETRRDSVTLIDSETVPESDSKVGNENSQESESPFDLEQ